METTAAELPIPSPPSSASTQPLLSLRLQQQSKLHREPSLTKPLSPRAGGTRDVRLRRSPPVVGRDREGGGSGGAGPAAAAGDRSATSRQARIKSKLRISPNAMPKSLLPVTERKSQEENKPDRWLKKDSDAERWDITPDGGSAGREGRQFTVANVGNNGRIYLRPTIRPAHQRYPQPHFVFPMTPPGTAGLDALTSEKQKAGGDNNNNSNGDGMEALDDCFTHDSQWTPTHNPSSPAAARRPFLPDTTRLPPHRGHRRAMSDSTIPDTSVARESDPGGFKIVITQPGEDQRPRTLEDFNPTGAPLLEVAIPSWKLGTPRFTLRGTPVIQGSSYAPTEEFRSSSHSLLNRTAGSRTPQAETFGFKKPPHPINIPLIQLDLGSPLSPETPRPLRPAYMSTQFNIEPSMFDALTFKPACDDRAIVRISSTTLAVTAATPPRLVAEITSPKFVDYELVSDFFLTFRAFLDAPDLLRMLIARLRWAVARDDEIGMVVRVRTFVALRHWILNYFMDDFVVDYQLRAMFCSLLNEFVDELSHDARGRKVQLKILAELKKCWRRVCAQYWDGAEFDASLGPEVPILPGGIAGHRDASLSPSFWEQHHHQQQQQQDDGVDGETDGRGPPHLGSILVSNSVRRPNEPTSFHADVSKAGHIDSIVLGVRPGTPENQVVVAAVSTEATRRNQASPTSMASVDVISCSFPSKNMRFAQMGANYPLAAHPADPSSVYTHNDLIATTPRALMGKRVRPQHATAQHKRNNSLTDSLREHATTAEKMLVHKNTEFLMTLPYAGSLVRGAVLPPGQAFVEVLPPSAAGGPSRQTTIFQPHPLESQKEKASAMSGQGMRKLLGSVRRALSTRGQGVSPTQGNFINISPIGPRGATTNRLPGTAIVPQARPRLNGVRPPVRIDLLGAEVAEDFKKAVREDAASEAARQGYAVPVVSLPTKVPGEMLEYSAAHMMGSMLDGADADGAALGREELPATQHRPVSDMGITAGSKSIVIVDDTLVPVDFPMMVGALPAVNSSVEAFAESFMPGGGGGGGGGGGDPTPPNTPPGHAMGTPRRSSYILSQHVIRPSLSADALPPLVTGDAAAMRRPSESSSIFPSHDIQRPSVDYTRQSPRQPPLSGIRGHLRHRSSKSYRSNRSFGRRRYASFTSGIAPQPTVRSFDATTYSEASVDDEASDVPMPQPLRVLRRRPGGDLRAVTNVGELDTERPLRRSRSVGSLTTYTDSLRSSYIRSPPRDSSGFVDVVTSDYSRDRDETFSLGAIAEQNPTKRRELSLFSTHSSKPVMRPSFEAEAQKLAQIPDDADDDGGVESALLKLEGKFEKRLHKLSVEPTNVPLDIPEVVAEDDDVDADEHYYDHDDAVSKDEKREHRHKHVGDEGVLPPHEPVSSPSLSRPSDPVGGLLTQQHRPHMSFLDVPVARPHAAPEEASSFLSAESGDSYSSIPLLERGLTDDGRSKTATHEWTNQSILQDDEDVASPADEQRSHSYEVVNKTDSMERIPPGESMPQSPRQGTEELSFLNDDSDDDSDLSSELSAELLGGEQDGEAVGHEDRPYLPTRTNTVASRLPAHPLAADSQSELESSLLPQPLRSHPPSPPMTLVQALQMSPETANIPEVHEHQLWEDKPLPPTPDTAPTTVAHGEYSPDPTGTKEVLRNTPKMLEPETARKFSVHLPFILAFDSDILAQQFTLIEKDALNEIDWKELIEMRWKNCENGDARSWVDFLRNTDARGVEVVIARFNIMVKWAVSEIVLTQDMEERARCIIKYIHIAAHCRRYRNFATMSQIAIALSSNEVSRLARTWSMVPPTDVRTLKDLEALVSPTRNFYNLRAEMEGVGITNADMGCIPFVGIYTHDLLFNSQRPSEIASSPTTAPLVNFERCRVAASIVKTLLRLLEASTLYTFQPIEGITERCLWMGALSDEEIRRYSEALE